MVTGVKRISLNLYVLIKGDYKMSKYKCMYCKTYHSQIREFDGIQLCDNWVNELYYDGDGNRKYKNDEIPPFVQAIISDYENDMGENSTTSHNFNE